MVDLDFAIQARAMGDFRSFDGLLDTADLAAYFTKTLEIFQRFFVVLCGMTRPWRSWHSQANRILFGYTPAFAISAKAAANMEYDVFHPYTRARKYRFRHCSYMEID